MVLTEKSIEILKSNSLFDSIIKCKEDYNIKIYLEKEELDEWKNNGKVLHIEVNIIKQYNKLP